MVEGNEEEKDSGWEKYHDICVIWYWICKFEWSTIRNFNFKLDIYIGFKPDLFFHNKIRNQSIIKLCQEIYLSSSQMSAYYSK